MKKKIFKIFLIIFFLILLIFIYLKLFKRDNAEKLSTNISEDISYPSNIIEDVNYNSRDSQGNEYVIDALKGEIDYKNTNIIFLTDVKALIKLKNSSNIVVTSKYGKYNTNNFDTIFSQNVIINYLDNKITSEYLDFSIKRNSMLISRNLIYTNFNNILTADAMELDIKTKNTKIFMYENNKKVNIKSKN
jgi:LPS export ABC transporter protein LptC